MRSLRFDYFGRGTGAVTDRLVGGTRPRKDLTNLIFARQALDRRQFSEAEHLLRRALDIDPESPEVWALMGALHERLGEPHAAYQCHKRALAADPHNVVARGGLRKYCERFGLDFNNPNINPASDRTVHD
jgi:tetratricopeptide (TPR) repeat protein